MKNRTQCLFASLPLSLLIGSTYSERRCQFEVFLRPASEVTVDRSPAHWGREIEAVKLVLTHYITRHLTAFLSSHFFTSHPVAVKPHNTSRAHCYPR